MRLVAKLIAKRLYFRTIPWTNTDANNLSLHVHAILGQRSGSIRNEQVAGKPYRSFFCVPAVCQLSRTQHVNSGGVNAAQRPFSELARAQQNSANCV